MTHIHSPAELSRTAEIDELEAHVQSKLGNRIRDLHIEQRYGGLVLYGYSGTYYAKQLAQHAVLGATDIPIVSNEIEVK